MKAIMLVHPGFLRREDMLADDLKRLEDIRSNSAYGSYQNYLHSLQILSSQIGEEYKRLLVVESVNSVIHPMHDSFEPRDGTFVFDWNAECYGTIYPLQRGGDSWIRKEGIMKERFSRYVLDLGITDVLLAGELGPYEGSFNTRPIGCVGFFYQRLKNDLPVVGVKKCIYPQVAVNSLVSGQEAMSRDLYDQAISLEDVIRCE